MKKQKMKLLSCILMGIGSIIGASVFATTPIAIKMIASTGTLRLRRTVAPACWDGSSFAEAAWRAEEGAGRAAGFGA